MGDIRAFRLTVDGHPDGICFARSASKARYKGFASLNDIGWGAVFGDITVRRAPEFDGGTYLGNPPMEGAIILETLMEKQNA